MKLVSAAITSGWPAASKNAAMNRFVSAGARDTMTSWLPFRMPGLASMTSSVRAASSIDGGSISSTA
jgi:hypothetical protein